MKRIVIFIVCLLMGFQSGNSHRNRNVIKNETRGKASIVSMKLVSNDITYPDLIVDIENMMDVVVLSGNEYDYSLVVDINGRWEEVKREPYVNHDIVYLHEAGKTRRMVFHLGNDYGELKGGRYRLIKEFFVKSEKDSNNEFEVSIDFYI